MTFRWAYVDNLEEGELFFINCGTQIVQFLSSKELVDSRGNIRHSVLCRRLNESTLATPVNDAYVLTFQSSVVNGEVSSLVKAGSLVVGQTVNVPHVGDTLRASTQGVIADLEYETRRTGGYEIQMVHITLTDGQKVSIYSGCLVEVMPELQLCTKSAKAKGHLQVELWF